MRRVDLHNHILPGLDDGCTDETESLALARLLVEQGFTDVAVTPHARPDFDPSTELCLERRQSLQRALDAHEIPLRLHPGREHHLTPELLERVASKTAQPLGNGPYLLLELPFAGGVPRLRDALFQIQLAGYRPVVAHPERCAHFVDRLENAEALFDAGVGFQLEMGSLAGIYGRPAKRAAEAFIRRGLVSWVATDAHRPASAARILSTGLKTLEKAVGPTRLKLWTEDNPQRVLRGEPLQFV